MARSNGQPGQAGGRTPQARQPAEPEFYAQTTQPTVPPHNLQYAPYQPAPAAYGAPVQQPNPMPQARPQQGYPPQGYYQPAQPQQQAYHEPAPAYAPQVAQPEQGYYPQHQAEPQQHADPNAGYAPQQQHFGGPQQPNPGYAPAQPPAPQAQQYAPQWSPQQAADPRGYDLGHFASAHDRTQPGHGQSHYQQGYAEPQQYAQEPAWDDPRAAYAQQHAEQPRIDPSHYGAQPTLAAARQGQPMPLAPAAQQHAQGYAEPHEDEYYDDDEEAAEPRRRGRGLLVVAGLVMAISAGAGLAYAYTQFGPSAGKGKAAILKADAQAGRMREASDADRKLPNRLAEDANGGQRAAPQTPETPDDPNAPRRVRTTTFTVGQPNAEPPAAAPPPPPRQSVGMGGVVLDGVGGPPAAPLPGMLPPVTPAPPGMVVAPPPGRAPAPRVAIANAAPPPPAAAPAVRVAAAPVTPKAAVPKVKVAAAAKESDAFTPPAQRSAVGAPASSGGGNGFVAVVASAKSAGDALKAYADLRQKYSDALGDKAADVQASDQSARGLGTIYRAVVGPPGSRETAAAVCTQLKAAGHQDCWVTSF